MTLPVASLMWTASRKSRLAPKPIPAKGEELAIRRPHRSLRGCGNDATAGAVAWDPVNDPDGVLAIPVRQEHVAATDVGELSETRRRKR